MKTEVKITQLPGLDSYWRPVSPDDKTGSFCLAGNSVNFAGIASASPEG